MVDIMVAEVVAAQVVAVVAGVEVGDQVTAQVCVLLSSTIPQIRAQMDMQTFTSYSLPLPPPVVHHHYGRVWYPH